MRGEHGKRLLRRRGEVLERSFAHCYETGAMRRAHLRGRQNIAKRVLVHAAGFNLGLVMRRRLGRGTPRGLQGAAGRVSGALRDALDLLRHALFHLRTHLPLNSVIGWLYAPRPAAV